jgi:hypothetical protein
MFAQVKKAKLQTAALEAELLKRTPGLQAKLRAGEQAMKAKVKKC